MTETARERGYELPKTVLVTFCPYDAQPIARATACYSTCERECWVQATSLKPADPPADRPRT